MTVYQHSSYYVMSDFINITNKNVLKLLAKSEMYVYLYDRLLLLMK